MGILEATKAAFERSQSLRDDSYKRLTDSVAEKLVKYLGDGARIVDVFPDDRRIVVTDGEVTLEFSHTGPDLIRLLGECPVCHEKVPGDKLIYSAAGVYEAMTSWQPAREHMEWHRSIEHKKKIYFYRETVDDYLEGTGEFNEALVAALMLLVEGRGGC